MDLSFSGFLSEQNDQTLIAEAFNSAPYELTFGKKSAGDVFFTFSDEDGKEYRIQFYTPQGLGKSVRQVFIGMKKGASYLDAQQKFKNPMKVIATLVEAMKQFLQTPLGKSVDGYAVNFSKKAFERGMTLIPKVIRQSGLKQKLNVMDLTFTPDDSRGYIWVLKKGTKPEDVFNGPKLKGVTWDDPDKVGDTPPASQSQVDQRRVGWYNEVAPAGNPGITCNSNKGIMLGGIGIRFAPTYGLYSGSSAAVNFKEIEGTDLDILAKKLKLPAIPSNVKGDMIKSSDAWWRSKGMVAPTVVQDDTVTDDKWNALVDALKKTYAGNSVKVVGNVAMGQFVKDGVKMIVGMVRGSESIAVNFDAYDLNQKQIQLPMSARRFVDINVNKTGDFPKVINLAMDVAVEIASRDAVVTGSAKTATDLIKVVDSYVVKKRVEAGVVVLSTTIPKYNTNIDGWTIETRFDVNVSTGKMLYGVRVMDSRGMRKSTYDIAIPYSPGLPQAYADKFVSYISNVTGQLSHVSHDGYNPTGAKLDNLVINDKGTILLNGADLGSNGARDAVLNKLVSITKAAEDAAKANRPAKVPVLTKTDILQKLDSMTTNTNNVEWQIYESDGKINVDWDLTFRRNTTTGAYMQYKSEITRANGAVVNMEAFLKGLGYKTDTFIFTLTDAQGRDATSDEAYSEYEKSLGGSVTGTK